MAKRRQLAKKQRCENANNAPSPFDVDRRDYEDGGDAPRGKNVATQNTPDENDFGLAPGWWIHDNGGRA